MTLFRILISTAGLSLAQASAFLKVSEDSAASWSSGRRAPPPGVIAELHGLISRQENAAFEAAEAFEELVAAYPKTKTFEIGISADDHEAQSLGWPTVSAHAAFIGRMISMLMFAPHIINRIAIVSRDPDLDAEPDDIPFKTRIYRDVRNSKLTRTVF
jgi:hypothetical protein